MRGGKDPSGSLFSYVDLEARVPRSRARSHWSPLRYVRFAGVLAGSAGMVGAPGPSMGETAPVTAQIVWTGDAEDCYGKEFSCFIRAMKASGANEEAIRFAAQLERDGDAGWAKEFRDFGRVDLLTTFHPSRANTNESFSLVNGSPRSVSVGYYELTDADKARPEVQRILRRYPRADLIFKLDASGLVRHETSNGMSRFVFREMGLQNGQGCLDQVAIGVSRR